MLSLGIQKYCLQENGFCPTSLSRSMLGFVVCLFFFKWKLWESLVNPSYKKKRWKLQNSEISVENRVPWLCSTIFPFSFYTFIPVSDLTFVLCHGYDNISDPSLCATSCHVPLYFVYSTRLSLSQVPSYAIPYSRGMLSSSFSSKKTKTWKGTGTWSGPPHKSSAQFGFSSSECSLVT